MTCSLLKTQEESHDEAHLQQDNDGAVNYRSV
jgi:hypothetical protein